MNIRLRRREARRALHAAKFIEARPLGVKPETLKMLTAKTRDNIHYLQIEINVIRRGR